MDNYESLEFISYISSLKETIIDKEFIISSEIPQYRKETYCECIALRVEKNWEKSFGKLNFEIYLDIELINKEDYNSCKTIKIPLAIKRLNIDLQSCNVKYYPIVIDKDSIASKDDFIEDNFKSEEKNKIYLTYNLTLLIEDIFNKNFDSYHKDKSGNLDSDIILSDNNLITGYCYDNANLTYYLTKDKTIKSFNASLNISVITGSKSVKV